MTQWLEGSITDKCQWNHRQCSLTIDVDLPAFTAGQFCRVGLPAAAITGGVLARPYSLVNTPGKAMEIFFNEVPGGPLSSQLMRLNPGDTLLVSPRPAGFFVLDEVPEGRQLWLLATGTGLGPYLPMLDDDTLWQRFEQVVLVHGARNVEELCYGPRLDAITAAHPNQFQRMGAVTRQHEQAQANFPLLQGRIPDLFASGSLEQASGLKISPEESQFMACGNPGMINGVLDWLKSRGMKKNTRREPGHLTFEAYQ